MRELRLDDYAVVHALWGKFPDGIGLGRSDWRDEIANKISRNPDLCLVAESNTDNQVIGTVIGGFDGRRGLIYHLAVDVEYQRLGVSRELMAEVERRLAPRGCRRA